MYGLYFGALNLYVTIYIDLYVMEICAYMGFQYWNVCTNLMELHWNPHWQFHCYSCHENHWYMFQGLPQWK